MTTNQTTKPPVFQAIDFYKDREYYKIIPGFLFDEERIVRVDNLEYQQKWIIECERLPDLIIINGEKYKLVKD
jgi:hypothetical protein